MRITIKPSGRAMTIRLRLPLAFLKSRLVAKAIASNTHSSPNDIQKAIRDGYAILKRFSKANRGMPLAEIASSDGSRLKIEI